MRLLPILSLLYTMCLIDRTNIGAARIAGINEELDLDVGERVSIARTARPINLDYTQRF